MPSPKHTPAPWKVGGVDENIWIERPNPADACLCDIVQSGFDQSDGIPFYTTEDKANAHLISAAPDLLAACRAFVTAHEKSLQLEKTDVALRLARAAIQKAEAHADPR